MPRGGSKKGEHRGNAKPKADGSPNAIMKKAVAPRRPGGPKSPPIREIEESVAVSQVIHGISSADDMTPKQVMLDNMHHFQNGAYLSAAMAIHAARTMPNTEETRRIISALEADEERLRRIASDEAYKVAPFIHPRLAAIAMRTDSVGDDIVQLMLDTIDEKNREHPMVIEHIPQKRTA
jgi:hypothetical protein